MGKPNKKSPYKLLVEGNDDKHAVIHLLKKWGFEWDNDSVIRPFISVCGGKDKMLKGSKTNEAELVTVVDVSSCTNIGVIVDADSDAQSRWLEVKEALQKIGVNAPNRPTEGGTIFQGKTDKQQIGVWLMPDNSADGMLEDFIKTLVPKDDVLWPEAQVAVEKAKVIDERFSNEKLSKAQIHTWLAWQEDPDVQFGIAISQKVLMSEGPLAESFVRWFKELFSAESAE